MSKRLTATRIDPACGTCRKKCRKCDRTRPVCKRCTAKGLKCEGYPPRFQFHEYESTKLEQPRAQQPARKRKQKAPAIDPAILLSSGTEEPSPQQDESPPSIPTIASTHSSLSPGSWVFDERASNIDGVLRTGNAQKLLVYFDGSLCDHLVIISPGLQNPFRAYILPLAYQHTAVLHAVLGLAACHLGSAGIDTSQANMTAALQHKLSAIQALSSLLLKEEMLGLGPVEEEVTLVVVLLLVLHDICESGMSSHGAHLTGITFLCGRVATRPGELKSPFKIFLLAALAWMDVLRGFSGAEKLAYPNEVRESIREACDLNLETLVGCPVEIFQRIGDVLMAGKAYFEGTLSRPDFQVILDAAHHFFVGWDLNQARYPTQDPEWRLLAEAYRHACLLRVLRFPDPKETPCEDARITQSVTAILDICAEIPMDSPFFKRLLFPLFLAGVDTSSPHQKHYVQLCIDKIKNSTGFQHPSMMDLLRKVWKERNEKTQGWVNVPWMEYTCSVLLRRQHDFLFF